ncbi:sulfatase family protein [Mycobacterium ulcerans str. Harvey]|uniref:Sulfatase family protein n=1 Tax=Mycobacterium ulcerans str. Harvey TaxID=1299332 RepID=A0ABP3AFC6_MYCUL|nr:sulfatase family protein [Mycobacterium ulcerans str. Harvey]
MSWPARITDRGGLRSQFHHVVDIAPTILEAAGIPAPEIVNGVAQKPHDGISLMYTFDDAEAADRRRTQYFEIGGLRGIYHEDWMACTYHGRILWRPGALPAFSDDRWEFYDLFRDYSQAADLSAQFPDKLEQLKALFDAEGVKNNVFPLDDRAASPARWSPGPRSWESGPRSHSAKAPPASPKTSFAAPSIGRIRSPQSLTPRRQHGRRGAAGGRGYFAGLSLYVQQGIPKFTYNYFGSTYTTVAATEALPAGKATVAMEFDYDGGGLGKGGLVRLLLNGRDVGQSRIERTVPLGFSADEGVDIGMDCGTPAADTYEGTFVFNATIEQVTIQLR